MFDEESCWVSLYCRGLYVFHASVLCCCWLSDIKDILWPVESSAPTVCKSILLGTYYSCGKIGRLNKKSKVAIVVVVCVCHILVFTPF